MIKLEDVSTISLMHNALIFSDNYRYKCIYELLSKYNIRNYKELEELLESKDLKGETKETIRLLSGHLATVKFEIDEFNKTGNESQMFTFDSYRNANIDDETASITDKNNKGEVLLYTLPFIKGGARLNALNRLSIDEIKYLLSHVDGSNLQNNALTSKRNFGPKIAEKTAKLIKFYEEQVVRQALENAQRGVNLFTLNKELKDEIVRSQLREIAEYILDTSRECIWGKMTDTARLKIYESVLSTKGENHLRDKQTLIDAISNYTTLGELESGILVERETPIIIDGVVTKIKSRTKPIDRFIIR